MNSTNTVYFSWEGQLFAESPSGRRFSADNKLPVLIGLILYDQFPELLEHLEIKDIGEEDKPYWNVAGDQGFARAISRLEAIGLYALLVGLEEDEEFDELEFNIPIRERLKSSTFQAFLKDETLSHEERAALLNLFFELES